ncbi:MAG: TIGR04325 family methyltransferase [Tenuifilaceae bacterium]
MISIKTVLKQTLPNPIKRFVTGFFYGWHGNYSSWDEALSKSTGYDSELIHEKVKNSLLKVKKGDAIYERDSMIFSEVEYSYPVLSGLMWIAAQNDGKINVLDYGGSLGSSYFQNKQFLNTIKQVNWCIVEQPHFVKTGVESFSSDKLHFFYTIDECINRYKIDVVLLSSVLQYLEKPYELLDIIKEKKIEYLIIDRTPYFNGNDRITVQKVNPSIYKAKYPCWFFNKDKFINYIEQYYNIILEFDALDSANIKSEFKGFLLKLK